MDLRAPPPLIRPYRLAYGGDSAVEVCWRGWPGAEIDPSPASGVLHAPPANHPLQQLAGLSRSSTNPAATLFIYSARPPFLSPKLFFPHSSFSSIHLFPLDFASALLLRVFSYFHNPVRTQTGFLIVRCLIPAYYITNGKKYFTLPTLITYARHTHLLYFPFTMTNHFYYRLNL